MKRILLYPIESVNQVLIQFTEANGETRFLRAQYSKDAVQDFTKFHGKDKINEIAEVLIVSIEKEVGPLTPKEKEYIKDQLNTETS